MDLMVIIIIHIVIDSNFLKLIPKIQLKMNFINYQNSIYLVCMLIIHQKMTFLIM